MTIYDEKIWLKSYDNGVSAEIDPKELNTTLLGLFNPAFKEFSQQLSVHYLGIDFTFKDIDNLSNKYANMLVENGFKKGDVLGISLVNTPQYLISYLGTLKAGGVCSGLSPLFSAEEIEYQLKDSKAKAVIVLDAVFAKILIDVVDNLPDLKIIIATNLADFLPGWKRFIAKLFKRVPKGKVIPITGKTVIKFRDILKDYSDEFEMVQVKPDDTALLMYTGGTTGFPKGSILSHKNVSNNMIQMTKWLQIERGKDIACSGFPFFHIAGLTFCNMSIYNGFAQILIPNPRDTNMICEAIKKFKPTMLVNVPTLYQMLIKNPKFHDLDHSDLILAISAASPFPVESINELEVIIGKEKLLEVYGMTECSPLVTMNPRYGVKKIGTVGLPLPNTEVSLLDPGTNEPVEKGKSGELCVKGPQVMKGYLNKPEANKKSFDKNGYFHTGDVAIMDDEGYFKIVDRVKDMIIVSGYKVYSSRVEDILTKHPAIEIVALVGIPDPKRPGSEIVKAYITKHPKYTGDNETARKEILEYAKEKLAPYEVPKIIDFRDELPMSIVGKVLKRELRTESQ